MAYFEPPYVIDNPYGGGGAPPRSIPFLSRYRDSELWHRDRGRSDKEVYAVKLLNGRQVPCLLGIVSHTEHEKLYEASSGIKSDLLKRIPSDDEVADWVREQEPSPPAPKPSIPDWVTDSWLKGIGWADSKPDFTVFESEHWVAESDSNEFLEDAPEIMDLASTACLTEPSGELGVRQLGKLCGETRCLLFLRDVHVNPEEILLVASFVGEPDTERMTAALKCIRGLERLDAEGLTPDLIRRDAWRSYPAGVLSRRNKDQWKRVQRDREANLALSREEERIFHGVRTGAESLPVFIDGRAGAGKSTILQYLYAMCCQQWMYSAPDGLHPPVYLTYSDDLVAQARRLVRLLLGAHGSVGDSTLTAEDLARTDRLFKSFRQYLLDMIPRDAHSAFQLERRIGYSEFATRYRARFVSKLQAPCGPEQAWYTIRSIIKGLSADSLLTPDEYKQQQVERLADDTVFDEVYSRVWSEWYQPLCMDQGLWDDQDLVRYAFQHVDRSSSAPIDPATRPAAVFCDEVQDFTRAELALIMRSSVYGYYAVDGDYVTSIPFALAGDPLQTLNPTGFKWASLTSGFYREIASEVAHGGASIKRKRQMVLESNYRSQSKIVRLANTIQMWRRVYLGLEAAAQRPYRLPAKGEMNLEPMIFVLEESSDPGHIPPDMIKRVAKQMRFLLPCDEGGELELVEEFPELAEILQNLDEWPYVKSAFAVKGLETEQVVLYGFGEYFARRFKWDWFEPSGSSEGDLRLEYFMNRLYVALTRPKRRLFIIDTEVGIDALWAHAMNPNELSRVAAFCKDPEWLRYVADDSLGPDHAEGSPSSAEFRIDPPLRAAQRNEAERLFQSEHRRRDAEESFGRAKRDVNSDRAALMHDARLLFEMEGDTQWAARSWAWELFYQHEYSKAAEKFIALGDNTDAAEALWLQSDWDGLDKLYSSNAGLGGDARRAAAYFMSRSPSDATRMRLAGALGAARDEVTPASQKWSEVIDAYVASYAKKPAAARASDTEAVVLRSIGDCGFRQAYDAAGRIFMEHRSYGNAAECWELAGMEKTDAYREARARKEGYPEALQYVSGLGDKRLRSELLLVLWEQKGLPVCETNVEWAKALVDALSAKGRHSEATEALIVANDLEAALKAVRQLARPEVAGARDVAARLVDCAVKDPKQWHVAYRAVRVDSIVKSLLPERGSTKDLEWRRGIVEMVAKSPESPLKAGLDNRMLADFVEAAYESTKISDPIELRVVGVALERVGRLVPAIQFYEKEEERAKGIQDYARLRWVQTRMAIVLARRTEQLEKDGRSNDAQVQRLRGKEYRDALGLTEQQLRSLADADPSEAMRAERQAQFRLRNAYPRTAPKLEESVGGVRFEVNAEDQTVVIVDLDRRRVTMELAGGAVYLSGSGMDLIRERDRGSKKHLARKDGLFTVDLTLDPVLLEVDVGAQHATIEFVQG